MSQRRRPQSDQAQCRAALRRRRRGCSNRGRRDTDQSSATGLRGRFVNSGPIRLENLTDRLGVKLDGMLAEYTVLSEEALVRVPSHLSFEEAATLPCAAVTAWVALTGHRKVTAGDTVLTQGSGGVSVFALQFARILGARVISTTLSEEKAEPLKALSASDVINYIQTPALELTDGCGVDSAVEIGGRGRSRCR
jgi:NADPH:quinone reductase-like Zn-dependent oxidoreductase